MSSGGTPPARGEPRSLHVFYWWQFVALQEFIEAIEAWEARRDAALLVWANTELRNDET
jgi:hypothetical protein